MEQNLYGFSTEPDADERRYGELAQRIRANPPHPPNSRSIPGWRKKAPIQVALQRSQKKRQRCRNEKNCANTDSTKSFAPMQFDIGSGIRAFVITCKNVMTLPHLYRLLFQTVQMRFT